MPRRRPTALRLDHHSTVTPKPARAAPPAVPLLAARNGFQARRNEFQTRRNENRTRRNETQTGRNETQISLLPEIQAFQRVVADSDERLRSCIRLGHDKSKDFTSRMRADLFFAHMPSSAKAAKWLWKSLAHAQKDRALNLIADHAAVDALSDKPEGHAAPWRTIG